MEGRCVLCNTSRLVNGYIDGEGGLAVKGEGRTGRMDG
jgi:hypothetical protein